MFLAVAGFASGVFGYAPSRKSFVMLQTVMKVVQEFLA
jgi:hypothetical protein